MPVEKGWLLVCGKTGRVVGLNRKHRWTRWRFPLIGLAALVWYLVRVIPKPSRAAYPCQRVAAPMALGGVVWLLSLFGLVTSFRKLRRFLYQHRYAAAGGCLLAVLVCAAVVIRQNESSAQATENTGTFIPAEGPNQPIGTARGIYPGRVAWSYNTNACNWDGRTQYWWSSQFNDQAKITVLMNNVICSVAGQPSVSNAWDVLFRCKNGGPTAPSYVKGQSIAIKINENNGGNNAMIDASPQSVYALLDGLVNQFGVSQTDITLCDPARSGDSTAVSNYCRTAFPNVNYNSNQGNFTANAFAYSTDFSALTGPPETHLATTIVNAKYLITMALLKRHAMPYPTYGDSFNDGNSPVTMIFKSDWGIIGGNRGNQHVMLHTWEHPIASYDLLVDIYGSTNINGKTVLTILDGLYSGWLWNSGPTNWVIAPFNGHYPSSIFASQDPVALESVGLDFIWADMGLVANADRHLREAALANNPPSGTVYKPDGVRLQSLGVHEHWNNSTNKMFSRNLGTGLGIELVTIPPNLPSVSISGLASGYLFMQGTNLPVRAFVLNNTNPISQIAFYQGTTLLGTSTSSPFGITWSNVPAGNFTLTAVAADSAGLSVTSNPVNIGVGLQVSITAPATGSLILQGTNLPIQAVATNDINTISQVAFYQGTQLLGSSVSSPYGITWSNVPSGGCILTAVATDSAGLSVTSSPVNITVANAMLTWNANAATVGAPQDGNGVWDLASLNWWNGLTNIVWNNARLPVTTSFGATNGPAGTVTLGAAIAVGNLAFNPAGSGNYTIAGSYALTLANTPSVNVAANCSPTISAAVAGAGFSKTGAGMLTLSGANSYSGTVAANGGTLAFTGNNSGSTAAGTVAPGATLQLANANAIKGALALNSGSTLQLRADSNTTFSPASITLDSAADTNNIDAGPLTSATGKTLALAGTLTFPASANSTINVTGNSAYTLALGNIIGTTTGHNPYVELALNTLANGPSFTIGTFQSGNWSQWLNLQGGGRVTITGNITNNSNGSSIVYVTGGTTAILQGSSALSPTASATADGYKYCVANGTLVLDNGNALTNNFSGAACSLGSSYFILGAATNAFGTAGSFSAPAGVLVNMNNSYNAAVYLGDPGSSGGITLNAKATNNVADGDVGFVNSGTMTIGGQNTSGTNTYANPIILGWTANKGKSVTLVAATGGEVDFPGGILKNGADATSGVRAGDATHGGLVKLTGANTYAGGTTVVNGTLRVNGSLAAGAVTVQSGGTLGGAGTVNGPVTIQSGGTLAPGDSIGTLAVNNNLTLIGNLFFKLNKSLSPSNDLVTVSGVLTNAGGGVLTVTNLGPALAAGDTFQLFNQALVNAGALTLSPATPGIRLRWGNNLAVNGSLSVVAVATNAVSIAPSSSISNLILSWPADHTGWRLQAQTNPLTFGLGTNWADVSGVGSTNQRILPISQGNGSVFFRLVYP
jgi:autotransporter-associated beta strand protein